MKILRTEGKNFMSVAMSCERIDVLEKPDQIGFRCFLPWGNRGPLEPQVSPESGPATRFLTSCESRTMVGLGADFARQPLGRQK
jgi:hypothetical protein